MRIRFPFPIHITQNNYEYFSECANRDIALMVYYFIHKDDENPSEYNTSCCKLGLSILSDKTGCGTHPTTEELSRFEKELMQEGARRYSLLSGLAMK
ncbi:MAG: hypothetical protein ACRDD8_10105 [Bacteroidales bacterium]